MAYRVLNLVDGPTLYAGAAESRGGCRPSRALAAPDATNAMQRWIHVGFTGPGSASIVSGGRVRQPARSPKSDLDVT